MSKSSLEKEMLHTDSDCSDNVFHGKVVKLDRDFPLIEINDSNREFSLRCELSADMKKKSDIHPVIGDKVLVSLPENHDMGVVLEIEPRATVLTRRDPVERAVSQTLASNFDEIMIVQPANDINLKRLERELVLAYETGAEVSVVLTKTDLVEKDLDTIVSSVLAICPKGINLYQISSKDKYTLDKLKSNLKPDTTTVLIGKSGVGKSTLINNLYGEKVAQTGEVRSSDGKGRHTTVSREIIELPNGSRIVDMPGVRGLGLWNARAGISKAFPDIEELEDECKFRDCKHNKEPGCAVRKAVDSGEISEERLLSYRGLIEELEKVNDARRQASWK